MVIRIEKPRIVDYTKKYIEMWIWKDKLNPQAGNVRLCKDLISDTISVDIDLHNFVAHDPSTALDELKADLTFIQEVYIIIKDDRWWREDLSWVNDVPEGEPE